MSAILHLLPRTPPALCGIADYAWQLARALRDRHGWPSRFLAAGTGWVPPESDAEFPVERVAPGDAAGLQQALGAAPVAAVVLHVSLYGYQKRGVPVALVRGLTAPTRGAPRLPLLAMFHELYASGPPTSSSFWLQPLQKQLLRRLARRADAVLTNRAAYAAWLNAVPDRRAGEAAVLPVFSNLGELAQPPPLAQCPPAMVMFASGIHGGGDAGLAVARAVHWCRRLGLQTLHLLGGAAPAMSEADGVRICHRGFLPAAEVSALLAQCRLASTSYHPEYLGKSGILAAYAAHGLAVISDGQGPELPDGLRHGHELLLASRLRDDALPAADGLQRVADGLHAWYQGHSLAATADRYAAELRRLTAPDGRSGAGFRDA